MRGVLLDKRKTSYLDIGVLLLYVGAVMLNVVSHFFVQIGGGVLYLAVLYTLCGYFCFYYGGAVRRSGKQIRLDFLFYFLILYIYLMQFCWNFSEKYESFGFTFNTSVWNLVSFVPLVVSAVMIVEKSNAEQLLLLRRWVIICFILTCSVSVYILYKDPLASRVTATAQSAYIPLLIGFGMAYAIPGCLPFMLVWLEKLRWVYKLPALLFAALVLICQIQTSFTIAFVAIGVGLATYFFLRIKNRTLRYGLILGAVALLVVGFACGWHIDFLYWLSDKVPVYQISARLYYIALYFEDGTVVECTERFVMYISAFRRFLQHPIFGNIIWNADTSLSGHSTILDILDGCGLLVFAFFVLFIGSIVRKNIQYAERRQVAAAWSSLLALLFIMLLNPIFNSPQILVFFILGAAAFMGKNNKEKSIELRSAVTVAEVNTYAVGSTGKIMLQVADCARLRGYAAYTFSGRNFTIKYKKMPPPPTGHVYFGTYLENALHFTCARIFGGDGFYSWIATRRLLRRLDKIRPDVLHLHNLHDYYLDSKQLFRYIKKNNIKVVWTLHDCWSFTGHCPHFDMIGCEKWKTECKKCPQHKYYYKSLLDNSRAFYRQKQKLFCGVQDLTLVTPSKWLADLTRESYLKEYPVKVIYNGIDLSVFQPTLSDFRKEYGLEGKFILLCVAFGWEKRKGLNDFLTLAQRLDERYVIVLVGVNPELVLQLPPNIIAIGRTDMQKQLAEIYTAADVFVNPTKEDNFPTVNLEALACGTPVITYRTGGSPEAIDESCGVVVEKDDIDGMQREIERICEEKPYSKEACLRRAAQFDMRDKFAEYVDMYEQAKEETACL